MTEPSGGPQRSPTRLDAWQQLGNHRDTLADVHLRELFANDPERFDRYSLSAAGLTLDYSKNRISDATLALFGQLADQCGLRDAMNRMFDGEAINRSEQRSVLHVALRDNPDTPLVVEGENISAEIRKARQQMRAFADTIHDGTHTGMTGKPIRHIVNIGIGGSFLGPRMVCTALTPARINGIQCHFVANVDGTDLSEVLRRVDPETTLFIVASKSFTTPETLCNAQAARAWFLENGGTAGQVRKHFIAVTSKVDLATEFGIAAENIFPMWDWVGGRYSLWSAIGLPILLSVGNDAFQRLLDGAHAMDLHFRDAPFSENMPVLMGMLGVWYRNFFHAHSHAVLPYDEYLEDLPAHLQQVDMESNGKSVTLDGEPVDYPTGPVIWGGVGANGQHAYHQLLHQGTDLIPADFIIPIESHNPVAEQHALLFASCLSQSQAMMQGKTLQEAREELLAAGLDPTEADALAPHKVIPGNRPSNTLLFRKTTPETIGALIALYEHKVFVQGAVWGINSFDQWGVELGKQLGKGILGHLQQPDQNLELDSSTRALCELFLRTHADA